MKPLYLMTVYSGDIRSRRASNEEIREHLAGGFNANTVLAHVSIDKDGNVIATALSDDEIKALSGEILQRERADLFAILDAVLKLARAVDVLSTHIWMNDAITIWPVEVPYAEDVVREWAERNALHVTDEPMPKTGKTWIRTMGVSLDKSQYARQIVRMQWPSVSIETSDVIAAELVSNAVTTLGEERVELPF